MQKLLIPVFFAVFTFLGLPAQAAPPDPANATFMDASNSVRMRNGTTYLYDSGGGVMQSANAVCRNAKTGRRQPFKDGACAQGFDQGFVDSGTGRWVSQRRGISEFSSYRVVNAMPVPSLTFTDKSGTDYAAVIVVSEPGGSGTFFSLGLVSGAGDGKQGSPLVALGDRVVPYWVTFDPKSNILAVSYLARKDNESMSQEPSHRVQRSFRVEALKLVEVNPPRQ